MPNYSGIWTEQAVMQAVGAGNWPGNPGAPTIGTATGGNASASVTFTAPANNGGSAITSYTVTSSPGSLTGTGASSPITVSGLTNGTAYTFTVRATNATGTGPASAASNSVTPAAPNVIEDVFSTYLYDGNSSTQTITNGINLSNNGGLLWIKARNTSGATRNHRLWTTDIGGNKVLQSDLTAALYDYGSPQVTFNSNGFGLSSDAGINATSSNYASWTFRKKSKFFDIVTYTGNGVAGRQIAHNLGSAPGCVIIKCLNAETNWSTWHNGIATDQVVFLNTTDGSYAEGDFYATAPTSSVFTVASFGRVNGSGNTYVAYLFADDAGGFGSSGNENVISCGSYTGTGSPLDVTLGYEPQWILIKRTSTGGNNWVVMDTMRGMAVAGANWLYANTSGAEADAGVQCSPTATGFTITSTGSNLNAGGSTYIYMAIRRGPMNTPTVGTSVFLPSAFVGSNSVNKSISTNFTVDMTWGRARNAVVSMEDFDRLRGAALRLVTDSTAVAVSAQASNFDVSNGITLLAGYDLNYSTLDFVNYTFARAPGFFEEICYSGTGSSGLTLNHNLGVVPELMIFKTRSGATRAWGVYTTTTGIQNILRLNTTAAVAANSGFVTTTPTSTIVYPGNSDESNEGGNTYVAYLFATCAGVSKVGSYTGTGATQTVNCGFAAGSRFVLIKATSTTGDWLVWDSARGIIPSNDPYLALNSSAVEVTGTDWVDTVATGFELSSASGNLANSNGVSYIFLAIA